MNWMRVILDGIMVSVYFNLAKALWWFIRPSDFYDDYPKEAREKTTLPKPEKSMKPKLLT